MRYRALLTASVMLLCAAVAWLMTAVVRRSARQPPEFGERVSRFGALSVPRRGASRLSKAMQRLTWRAGLTTLVVALCACAVAFAQTGPGRRMADSIGLSSPAESFTELYFTEPTVLAGQTPRPAARRGQTVTFEVRSHEPVGKTYAWTIATATGRQLAAGAVAVSAGGSTRINRTVKVCRGRGAQDDTRTVHILVALAHPAESISYWTQCDG